MWLLAVLSLVITLMFNFAREAQDVPLIIVATSLYLLLVALLNKKERKSRLKNHCFPP